MKNMCHGNPNIKLIILKVNKLPQLLCNKELQAQGQNYCGFEKCSHTRWTFPGLTSVCEYWEQLTNLSAPNMHLSYETSAQSQRKYVNFHMNLMLIINKVFFSPVVW